MTVDDLIETLAQDVSPVSPGAAGRRMFRGILGGGVIVMAAVVLLLGIRHDLAAAIYTFSFWMKLAYTLSLSVGAIVITARLARPEPVALTRFWPAAIPIVALAGLSALELAQVRANDALELWLGQTWKRCPLIILALSAPIFAGLLWSFSRLAPTNLRTAGGATGFTSGAIAATLYCFHCPEVASSFVLTWYTLGIALAALIGSLLGPRLLRW